MSKLHAHIVQTVFSFIVLCAIILSSFGASAAAPVQVGSNKQASAPVSQARNQKVDCRAILEKFDKGGLPPDQMRLLEQCRREGPLPPLVVTNPANNNVEAAATGGPDDYGYTWQDTSGAWIDATTGTDTGLSGDDVYTGPITIPFPVDFYGTVYTQLYINSNGYVVFGNSSSSYFNYPIPFELPPNNIMAVFWDDQTVGGSYNSGKIYYKLQGTGYPHRFVIEWHNVTPCCSYGSTDYYDYELVLREEGGWRFQYKTMLGSTTSATIGVEDSTGTVGLQYLYNSAGLPVPDSIFFSRPNDVASVLVSPRDSGGFTTPNASFSHVIKVTNFGTLGADTFDLFPSTSWNISLYAANGVTPLTDTDADGQIDTGSIAQGDSRIIIPKVTAPAGAVLGDFDVASLQVRSSLNLGKSKTVFLRTAIPAPFAQAFSDSDDYAMRLFFSQPHFQAEWNLTGAWAYGYEPVITRLPTGYIYLWYDFICLDLSCDNGVYDLKYYILDKYGNSIGGLHTLVNNSMASMDTYDYAASVAVAPDGSIGITWIHEVYDDNLYVPNYNIEFAILDPLGNIIHGPTNLTNNTGWGYSNDGVPEFYHPTIAATGDNRFAIAWNREIYDSGWLEDVYLAIYNTAGAVVLPTTNGTNASPGGEEFYDPTVVSLSGNNFLVAAISSYYGLIYAVLDSNALWVKGITSVGVAGGAAPDAVQLSDGKILLAAMSYEDGNINFAILDASYNLLSGPTSLVNAPAISGNDYVAVTADSAGHGIITWTDYNWSVRRNIYYALVGSDGSIITQPMIFRSSYASSNPYIETSYNGGSLTSSPLQSTGVDLGVYSQDVKYPGTTVTIPVRVGNFGTTGASSVQLTATLNVSTTYLGNSVGLTPSIVDNVITFDLGPFSSFAAGSFDLYLSAPHDPNVYFTIFFHISSAEPDANNADNDCFSNIYSMEPIYLPLVIR